MGDMVCTTPLLEGLKHTFPEAKLTLLVNKIAEEGVQHMKRPQAFTGSA